MLEAARCIVYRDLLLALRRRADVATALLFFVIVASLFPRNVEYSFFVHDRLRGLREGPVFSARNVTE